MESSKWSEDGGPSGLGAKRACLPDYAKEAEEAKHALRLTEDFANALRDYVRGGRCSNSRTNSLKELYGYLAFEIEDQSNLVDHLIEQAEKQQEKD